MQYLCKGLPVLAILLMAVSQVFGSQIHADGSAVIVNGETVFHIATSFSGLDPAKRARSLAAKLETLAFWGDVKVQADGASRLIVVSGEPVVTVTPEEAAAQRSEIGPLAENWASRLKDALSLPPLKLSDNFLRIPEGGSGTVKITGSEVNEAVAGVVENSIATVKRYGDTLKVSGRSVGHTILSVTAGRAMENVDVQVLPYAAAFPQTIQVFVTGAPATPQMVRGVVEEALKTKFAALPTARWTFGHVQTDALPTGESRTYTVHAWATAPEAFPSGGAVDVVVRNAAVPLQTDDDLWYSNDPETVRQPGSLFSATLNKGASARLLYHHVNGTMEDMFLRVEAINESDDPARVEVIPGDGRPDKDPVKAGVCAADAFVQNWMYGSGEVITIPPKSVLPLSFHRLSPGETASGLCSLRLIEGSDLLVRTDAFPPLPLDEKWEGALFSSTPWREVGVHAINEFDRAPCEASPHIYPSPYLKDSVSYDVGGRFGFLRIGQKPIARQDSDGVLDGNFGVIYNIKVDLKNPTADPVDVELVFEASAGYAGGIFIVNGSYVKTPLLAPKATSRIARYHLAPGATESLDLTTLPLAGCSYPATLIVRPLLEGSAAYGGHTP